MMADARIREKAVFFPMDPVYLDSLDTSGSESCTRQDLLLNLNPPTSLSSYCSLLNAHPSVPKSDQTGVKSSWKRFTKE